MLDGIGTDADTPQQPTLDCERIATMHNISIPPGFHPIRHDRLIQEQVHDAYQIKDKLPEPTVCKQCNAVFHEGRWRWGDVPAHAHQAIRPACHRINDHFPA